ncbi:rhomboid family intramembrane serine protease [Candidatus Woesearchaeota archaeon]|nr:rhomboid family intramembrane serine protease [Candidatus Woesearchaeota archaeon]
MGKDAFNRPWTLITSIFLHGSLEHLMYNLFALALFGIILENVIGTRKFLVLFFISGLFASVISSFFYNSALGASGAIYGILGALVVLRPTMQIWAYYIPMPMYIAGLVYFVVNFFGAYFGIGNTGKLKQ